MSANRQDEVFLKLRPGLVLENLDRFLVKQNLGKSLTIKFATDGWPATASDYDLSDLDPLFRLFENDTSIVLLVLQLHSQADASLYTAGAAILKAFCGCPADESDIDTGTVRVEQQLMGHFWANDFDDEISCKFNPDGTIKRCEKYASSNRDIITNFWKMLAEGLQKKSCWNSIRIHGDIYDYSNSTLLGIVRHSTATSLKLCISERTLKFGILAGAVPANIQHVKLECGPNTPPEQLCALVASTPELKFLELTSSSSSSYCHGNLIQALAEGLVSRKSPVRRIHWALHMSLDLLSLDFSPLFRALATPILAVEEFVFKGDNNPTYTNFYHYRNTGGYGAFVLSETSQRAIVDLVSNPSSCLKTVRFNHCYMSADYVGDLLTATNKNKTLEVLSIATQTYVVDKFEAPIHDLQHLKRLYFGFHCQSWDQDPDYMEKEESIIRAMKGNKSLVRYFSCYNPGLENFSTIIFFCEFRNEIDQRVLAVSGKPEILPKMIQLYDKVTNGMVQKAIDKSYVTNEGENSLKSIRSEASQRRVDIIYQAIRPKLDDAAFLKKQLEYEREKATAKAKKAKEFLRKQQDEAAAKAKRAENCLQKLAFLF